MDLTINKILNMAKNLEISQNFQYNQHAGIGGKPFISEGNQSLKTIPLKIRLHSNFCNPAKAVEIIEDYAKNHKEIDWFQSGEYLGCFVIEAITSSVEQKHKDAIVWAELKINLLESPRELEDFVPTEAETIKNVNKIKPTLAKQLKEKSLQIVKDNMYYALNNASVSSVSDIGNVAFNTLKQEIINNVTKSGLTGIYDYTDEQLKKMDLFQDLSIDEKAIIANAVKNIPDAVIDAALG